MIDDYITFMKKVLVPCANKILLEHFEIYCEGKDIGIEIKSDNTPASHADLKTEEALRLLIKERYPNHGIWGEELGAENIESDYVWVLDPLDGTREFLAKKKGCFGTLIGLLYKGKPVAGSISDPINSRLCISNENKSIAIETSFIKDSVIACTNPSGMFKTMDSLRSIQSIESAALIFKTHLNCLGVYGVIDGGIDAVIENDLSLHDIVALIPVLKNANAVVLDFQGNNYGLMTFDLLGNRKFGIIAASNVDLAQEILSNFQEQEAA